MTLRRHFAAFRAQCQAGDHQRRDRDHDPDPAISHALDTTAPNPIFPGSSSADIPPNNGAEAEAESWKSSPPTRPAFSPGGV